MRVMIVPAVRLFACGLALLATASLTSAQPVAAGGTGGQPGSAPGALQFGLEGGLSISDFTGDAPFDSRSRRGPYGGITLIVQPQASAIGFQTGVLYVTKGAKSDDSDRNATSVSGGVKLSYIEVPLMLRIGVPMNIAGIAPTLTAGGSIGYRVGCRVQARGLGLSTEFDCDDALAIDSFDARRFDGGVTVGVEVPVSLGSRMIVVPTVRYTRGLVNIVDGSGGDVKNSAVQIGFGLRFR